MDLIFLRSLVKAAIGTGMVENANYNNGKPFFVSFRPLLHDHAALPDDVLANYNKYNLMIDDLDYQLEQLKATGTDIFDITLELKLAKDKLKSGNFNMVDIYLESLKPRLTNEFKKMNIVPKKYEVKLIDLEALDAEAEAEAKKAGKAAAPADKKEATEPDEKKPESAKAEPVANTEQPAKEEKPESSEEQAAKPAEETKDKAESAQEPAATTDATAEPTKQSEQAAAKPAPPVQEAKAAPQTTEVAQTDSVAGIKQELAALQALITAGNIAKAKGDYAEIAKKYATLSQADKANVYKDIAQIALQLK